MICLIMCQSDTSITTVKLKSKNILMKKLIIPVVDEEQRISNEIEI